MTPIISIVGRSGAGKTTLMEKLIPELRKRGLKVATIKHDVHGFEMDHPGKDSWRHKEAGSNIAMISSPDRIGMVMDVDHDYTLDELGRLISGMDIILSEGYKRGDKPKVEIYRPAGEVKPLCADDHHLIAVITNAKVEMEIPLFSLDDISGLADFLITRFHLR
jgi:molybdopterin-guanine dinucleotide biosynthesis adapter protein